LDEIQARGIVGQVFALRFPRKWESLDLDRFPVANYIVFSDALEASFEDSASMIKEARQLLRRRHIEPLFMIDEEGGRVTQISGFFPSAPSPRAIAASLTPEEAAIVYAHLSANLAEMGININLAPCLDVNTEPLNPIIGTRSFGPTPETVSAYGLKQVAATHNHLACVGKHFPGHGMTRIDSHLDLPVVDLSEHRIERVHLPPFVEATHQAIDGIMISHCNYSRLQEGSLPASLSEEVVTDLLRRRIGFQGLVLTDSLDMAAIVDTTDPYGASGLALGAGCDVLLYTQYSERFELAFEGAVSRLLLGDLEEDLAASIRRRNHVLARQSSRPPRPAPADLDTYLRLCEKARRYAVKIEDPRGLLPLTTPKPGLVSTDPEIAELLRSWGQPVRQLDQVEGTGDITLVLWLTEPLKLKHSLQAMRSMIERSRHAVLVTTYQALIERLPPCDATILYADTSPDTRQRIARCLFKSP
jgi:beta-glucosidase-like glycosyl hydrolase